MEGAAGGGPERECGGSQPAEGTTLPVVLAASGHSKPAGEAATLAQQASEELYVALDARSDGDSI